MVLEVQENALPVGATGRAFADVHCRQKTMSNFVNQINYTECESIQSERI